jgi:sucrose phosphorylase
MRHTPQLITYADRLAGDLAGLQALLDGPFKGAFTGVHVLPFFVPIDGSDAGFDPTDHAEVDPRIGTWDDISRLAERYEVMADLIVNHVSAASTQFRDWLEHGANSEHDGMFVTFDHVFADGADEERLNRVYRPRPGLPFTRVRLADESVRLMWTTFTSNQIDIDVEHETGWRYLVSIIDRLADAGVTAVRLDAVGYAIKRAGTSCFMIPETYEFIGRLSHEFRSRQIDVLVEIHGYHGTQIEIARHVDLVYDFALPPLVLDALYRGDPGPLKRWIDVRPNNTINVLDTHDGIGVIDIGPDPVMPERPGLIDPEQLSELVEEIHRRSGGSSQLATGAAASNLDLYQVNCTFYDALGRDDARYLVARLVQCVLPGVPQVYYVGLLGGTNDVDLLERTAVGRDINRHVYSADEVADALDSPVVRALLAMLRWRTRCSAFDGSFQLVDAGPSELAVRWLHPGGTVERLDVTIDFANATFTVSESGPGGVRVITSANDL